METAVLPEVRPVNTPDNPQLRYDYLKPLFTTLGQEKTGQLARKLDRFVEQDALHRPFVEGLFTTRETAQFDHTFPPRDKGKFHEILEHFSNSEVGVSLAGELWDRVVLGDGKLEHYRFPLAAIASKIVFNELPLLERDRYRNFLRITGRITTETDIPRVCPEAEAMMAEAISSKDPGIVANKVLITKFRNRMLTASLAPAVAERGIVVPGIFYYPERDERKQIKDAFDAGRTTVTLEPGSRFALMRAFDHLKISPVKHMHILQNYADNLPQYVQEKTPGERREWRHSVNENRYKNPQLAQEF